MLIRKGEHYTVVCKIQSCDNAEHSIHSETGALTGINNFSVPYFTARKDSFICANALKQFRHGEQQNYQESKFTGKYSPSTHLPA